MRQQTDQPAGSGTRIDRRHALVAGLAALGALARPAPASAQARFPAQPVRLVVPFGPGGLADISARMVAQPLGERLGQPVVIENRPGAGGVVAAQAVLNAPHDGTTLILFANGTAIAPSLMRLPYDPQKDFAAVSSMAYFDLNLLVARNSPFPDLRALLAAGRQRSLTFATINPGSTQHLSAALFQTVSGVAAQVIPFKTSGEVQTALQRGDVDLGFESYAALRGGIDAGVLRALATTGPRRTEWLPQVPTVKEAGLDGYEVTGWNAVYAAAGVPQAHLDTIGDALRAVLAQAPLQRRLLDLGVEPRAGTAAEMTTVFERDRRKWAQVIQQAHIKI